MPSLFKDMLGFEESLFKNEVALSYEFIPKLVPYREWHQRYMASCIKPLLQGKNGKNLLIFGAPGIGKTVVCKKVLQALEEEEMDENIYLFYVNCWQKNTAFKIMLEICDLIGYKLTHNKRTDELFRIIKKTVNKKSAVFVFDEADKIGDLNLVYMILEEIYNKSIFLITNFKDWLNELDQRLISRLSLDYLEFLPYKLEEVNGILKQRMVYAFVPDVWAEEAFDNVVKKTFELKDIRQGLFLLKETGLIAESKSSKKILTEHSLEAINKLKEFSIKDANSLKDNSRLILDLIKKSPKNKIGELYKTYLKEVGDISYKSFQRRVSELAKDRFISIKKLEGGKLGNTTIVSYREEEKKITDF